MATRVGGGARRGFDDDPPVTRAPNVPRLSRRRALLAGAFACLALLGWQGVTTIGATGRWTPASTSATPSTSTRTGRCRGRRENYEYATPPLFHAVAIAAEHACAGSPRHRAELPSNVLDAGALAARSPRSGIACLTSARRGSGWRGAAALALVAVWSVDEAISLGKTQPWSAGQLVSLAACLALVAADRADRARGLAGPAAVARSAAAAFVAAYPVVYRMGILFHPEMLFARSARSRHTSSLRAARLGWPAALGWAAGRGVRRGRAHPADGARRHRLRRGGGASSPAAGRRVASCSARRSLTVLLAGPWWGYATHTWGNPLQSNLEPRASLMLDHQPRVVLRLVPAADARRPPLPAGLRQPAAAEAPRRALERLVRRLPSGLVVAVPARPGDMPRRRACSASSADAARARRAGGVGIPAAVRVVPAPLPDARATSASASSACSRSSASRRSSSC